MVVEKIFAASSPTYDKKGRFYKDAGIGPSQDSEAKRMVTKESCHNHMAGAGKEVVSVPSGSWSGKEEL